MGKTNLKQKYKFLFKTRTNIDFESMCQCSYKSCFCINYLLRNENFKKYLAKYGRDDTVGNGALCQAWRLSWSPQPHKMDREETPSICLLTSVGALWHEHPQTHTVKHYHFSREPDKTKGLLSISKTVFLTTLLQNMSHCFMDLGWKCSLN